MALELVRSVWDGFWGPKWGGLGVMRRFTVFCVLCAECHRSAHTGRLCCWGGFGQAAELLMATVPPLSSKGSIWLWLCGEGRGGGGPELLCHSLEGSLARWPRYESSGSSFALPPPWLLQAPIAGWVSLLCNNSLSWSWVLF